MPNALVLEGVFSKPGFGTVRPLSVLFGHINTPMSVSVPHPLGPIDPQAAAIDHRKGPCLVLAAPGSGKTWVITQRFIKLVRKDNVQPGRILALTYNRRAADEMVSRVQSELGALDGEPTLTTYNSWAANLVKTYGWHIGYGINKPVEIASGAQQWMFLAQAIAEVQPKYLFNPARPYDAVPALSKVISRAKQELVTPEQYKRWVTAKMRTAQPEEMHDLQRQKDVADVYAKLQQKYRDAGLVDHDDCISIATEILRKVPAAKEFCKNFDYVMVDEYQDTNTAQAVMVEQLVGRRGNLLVVADDDQSIYRFRGASQVNIRRFRDHFPKALQLTLPVNRRSTPEIVGVAQEIIEGSISREAKTAVPMRPPGDKVELITSETYRDEAASIVKVIQERVAAGESYKDIAVLFRNNSDMDALLLALQSASIPYVTRGGSDFFRAPEIKAVVALLEAIDNPVEAQPILACLAFPEWGMTEEGWDIVSRAAGNSDVPLIDRLREGAILGLSDGDRDAGKQLALAIRDLHRDSRLLHVRDLFGEAMMRTGYAGITGLGKDLQRRQFSANVSRMMEIIREFSSYNKDASLRETLNYLGLMRESNAESVVPLGDEVDGVRLCTIHSVKGLEFSSVIVAGCVDGKMPTRNRGDSLSLPDDFLPADLPSSEAHLQDELHLFYVAATRAKNHLAFTAAARYPGQLDRPPRVLSPFLSRIPEDELVRRHQPPSLLPMPRARTFPEPAIPNPLRLSYSSMASYEKCPAQYQFRVVDHVPALSSPDATFGTLVHQTLADAMTLRRSGRTVDTRLLTSLWQHAWETGASGLRVSRPELKGYGEKLLRNYATTPAWKDQPAMWVEHPFTITIEPGLELVGRFDRVDDRQGQPVVVDYKTGNPRDLKALKSDKQLRIYAIALQDIWERQHGKTLDEISCEIHWLKTGGVSSVSFTNKELQTTRRSIATKAKEIKAAQTTGNLPVHPSQWTCGMCSFRTICHEGRKMTEQGKPGVGAPTASEPLPVADAQRSEWTKSAGTSPSSQRQSGSATPRTPRKTTPPARPAPPTGKRPPRGIS